MRNNLRASCARPLLLGDGLRASCKSRSFYECPHCALLYRGDWQAIIRDGVNGIEDERLFMFVTLTAPSFGDVHRVPKLRGEKVGRCACGRVHSPEQANLRGVAVDMDSYDYFSQASFNRDLGALWHYTLVDLRRKLPVFEYVAVREWQARGVLHLHVLMRFPAYADPVLIEKQIRQTVSSVQAVSSVESDVRQRWGRQMDVQNLGVSGGGAGADLSGTVGYIGKVLGYVGKTLGYSAERVEGGGIRRVFFARLAEAAASLPCSVGCQGRCDSRRHKNYGAAASVVSQSRHTEQAVGWSPSGLTRKQAIDVRTEYMRMNGENSGVEESPRVYQGFGKSEWLPFSVRRAPVGVRVSHMLNLHQEAYLQGITADSG